MKRVIVIGGGPAGMFAALAAAGKGHDVLLLEKNEKLGKKLYLTGKGRCNITNAADRDALFEHVVTNRKFLYHAFYACDNASVVDFFENHGVPTKTERGNRIFPASDRSSDVISALGRALRRAGVEVRLNVNVEGLLIESGIPTERLGRGEAGISAGGLGREEAGISAGGLGRGEAGISAESRHRAGRIPPAGGQVRGVLLEGGGRLEADAVIVATGGLSYPSTGSTGDGYRFARQAGHTVTSLSPSLVPFHAKEAYVKKLQGLSLKNVRVTISRGKKILFQDFGEMLFTHFGVSGPLILSASSLIGPWPKGQELALSIDLKPALEHGQLDRRLLRDFEESGNKQFKNAIRRLLPAKMLPIIIELSSISPSRRVSEITREERGRLASLLKNFPVTLDGVRGYGEAIVTRGGISVKEVNPSTMESKLVSGLYFAGEVLDLDALTGGFNLQIAWSTGHLAGDSIG